MLYAWCTMRSCSALRFVMCVLLWDKKAFIQIKSETAEGAAEFVTRADLISNRLIVDLLSKYPGIKVR